MDPIHSSIISVYSKYLIIRALVVEVDGFALLLLGRIARFLIIMGQAYADRSKMGIVRRYFRGLKLRGVTSKCTFSIDVRRSSINQKPRLSSGSISGAPLI